MYWEFISQGHFILPIHPIGDDGFCSCSNKNCPPTNAGKHPTLDGWQTLQVEWDDEQLEIFERQRKLEAYGVRLNDLLVIDVDERNGGPESFAMLAELIPEVLGAGMIVRTGSSDESKHYYFKRPKNCPDLMTNLPQFKGVDFKSGSGAYVVGAGSLHRSGREYAVVLGSLDEVDNAPEMLIQLLERPEIEPVTATDRQFNMDTVSCMLGYLDPNVSYEDWAKIGAAVYDATNGTGFDLFNVWSRGSSAKYDEKAVKKQWQNSAKYTSIHGGTLEFLAREKGWMSEEDKFHEENKHLGAEFTRLTTPFRPLDTSQVDITAPMGLVGRIKDWIDSQCLYPREQLSLAAALTAVGNIAGLHHYDTVNNMTLNLLTFSAAASSTGKEAVYQAFNTVMREAGLAPAVHGWIKSEQEVIRNLVEHQASFYAVDELGEHLAKIMRARQRGGAVYLEGIITQWMAVFTKANGWLPVTGDTKRELTDLKKKEIAQLQKMLDANEGGKDGEEALKRLFEQLESLAQGIEEPFLSVFGTCLPEQLNQLMTHEMATNGFMARALIFIDHEDNPWMKENFKKLPMPEGLKMEIKGLSHAFRNQPTPHRIEHVGERRPITTTPDALLMMQTCQREYHLLADEKKEKSGLQAIYRRGFELLIKISLILSAQTGVRTVAEVLWAHALVKDNLAQKNLLTFAQTSDNKVDALAARVIAFLDKDTGKTLAVIKNRLRQPDGPIKEILQQLVNRGIARTETSSLSYNKKSVTKYFKTC